jgi:hypothetical protein
MRDSGGPPGIPGQTGFTRPWKGTPTTLENTLDINDLQPGLPNKAVQELSEAGRGLHAQAPSTSRLAGSFSTPASYNLDALHEASKNTRQAVRPAAMQGMQFGDQRPQRMTSAAERLNPQHPQTIDVHVHQQRPEPQRQPEYTPSGQYDGPDIPDEQQTDIAGRIAREIVGGYPGRVEGPSESPRKYNFKGMPGLGRQPQPVSATPVRGQLGGQFRDIVPAGYPGNQTYGENPYQSVNDKIETGGYFAGADQQAKQNARKPAEWAETSPEKPAFGLETGEDPKMALRRAARSIPDIASATPQPGKVTGSQFDKLALEAGEDLAREA